MAAVSVVPSILDYVGDDVIRNQLLPRAKFVHSANGADVKIVLSLLACIAKVNLVGAYLSGRILTAHNNIFCQKHSFFYQIYEVHAICAAAPCRIETIVQKDGGCIK